MQNTYHLTISLPFGHHDDTDDPVSALVANAFKAMGLTVIGTDYTDIKVDGVRFFLEPNADLDGYHEDFYGQYGADAEVVTLTYRKAM